MRRTERPGTKSAQIKFRAPSQLAAQIEEAAAQNRQNASEEIRQRLEASFAGKAPGASVDDPWFAELLVAINHAAAAAAKLHPLPTTMLTEADKDRWSRYRAKDTTAYESFVEAAHMLFQAFAPEGTWAVTPETGMRLAYQIAAVALGALGDRGLERFAKLPPIDQELMKSSGGAASRFVARAEQEGETE